MHQVHPEQLEARNVTNGVLPARWSRRLVGHSRRARGAEAGERKIIDGVEYVGIDQGQVLLAWHKFLSSERPDWLFWECSYHLLGALVEIAKLRGIRTIFHAGFDTDFEPRKALAWRPRWWPLYAWGLSRTDRIFVQHTGQLSSLRRRWQSKSLSTSEGLYFCRRIVMTRKC